MDLLHVQFRTYVQLEWDNQICTFVKIRFDTVILNSIHTVHNQSINILVKYQPMRIHGQYLSYKQAICTNVYNEKQSGFGSFTCLTLA